MASESAGGLNRRQVLVALAGWFGACAPAPARSGLASLSPALTETLAYLGGLSQVVARSTWCTHPPEVLGLPAAGTALTPDYEALVRLAPQLILVEAASALPRSELEAIGQVEVLPWLRLGDVQASVLRLGTLVDQPSAAAALVSALDALQGQPQAEAPVALALLGSDPQAAEFWYVRTDSLHGQVLASAGWRPALPEPPTGPPVLSLEALIRLDPEVLMLLEPAAWGPDQIAQRRAAWAQLSVLRAVRTGRVHLVASPTVLSTGPAILQTRAALSALRGG